MKKMVLNKNVDMENGYKQLTISQSSEDKESKTSICKVFSYHISEYRGKNNKTKKPEILVRKTKDSKNKVEKFYFEIKGCFYVKYQRKNVCVQFHHKLDIEIKWKVKYPHKQKICKS